jgi:transposase
MRFVSLKSEVQLDLQALHRARERPVLARTGLINQLRAVLLERGITIPKGRAMLMRRLREIGLEALQVSARTRRLLAELLEECAMLDRRIRAYDDEFASITQSDEQARRLSSIPGVGVINATALVAAVGDGSAFARGRDLAAWLGLSPRQHSTGGKTKILGISKRGNQYMRKQLIHGARAAMPHMAAKQTTIGVWLQQMLSRSHPNVVVVALAAKLARIVWAVLRHKTSFDQEVLV